MRARNTTSAETALRVISSPQRGADRRHADVGGIDAGGLGEGLLQLDADVLGLVLDLHLDDVAAVGVALLDLGLSLSRPVVVEDRAGVVDGELAGRHVPRHATLEVDAEHEAALPQRQRGDHQQDDRDAPSTPSAGPRSRSPSGRGRAGASGVGRSARGAPGADGRRDARRLRSCVDASASEAERVVAVETTGVGHQDDGRPGEEPQHDDVADRRHAEVEGEAADRADAEHEQHGGGDERHEVGGEDRPPRRLEAAGRRVAERAPVQHLVLHPLEVDDVAVDGHADRHDDAGDPGEREGVVGRSAR